MKIANAPKKRKHKGLIILILLFAAIAGIFLDSRYRIAVTEYELKYANLPQIFEKYSIVQLSDLHLAEYGKNNSRIIALTAKQQPDIIVLTGDFINMSSTKTGGAQTEELKPFLEELVKIAPCYFISGNHEWASTEIDYLAETLSELGIVYLSNEFVFLEKDGESIMLAGVEDPNGPADMIRPDSFAEIMRRRYGDKFKILLAHRNDWMKKYPALPVDLIICGHAHGGVVRIPFIGGLFGTGKEFLPEYDAGVFNEGNYDMVISRGLGGNKPMPRFLNNPEIVTIILRSA
ncbi:MAG: hypothetical protein GX488_04355 [Clostridiales bacterium]|nr:hypothetical protein [Clostridiales bacterium]